MNPNIIRQQSMKKPFSVFRFLSCRYIFGLLSLLVVCVYLYPRSSVVLVSDFRTIVDGACSTTENKNSKPICCPDMHPLELTLPTLDSAPTYLELVREYPTVCRGSWEPTGCKVNQRIAILIPYRNRELHLRLLLHRLHSMLQHQNSAYSIFVIEQSGTDLFNRGLLLNIGIRESLLRDPNITCFIFHDVDLLPDNSQNLYICDSNIRHLSSGIDEFRYHVPFPNSAGGVTSLSKGNVLKVNGFPNRYWGWGTEDDELAARCMVNDIKLSRPPEYLGRYHAMSHVKATRGAGHYSSFLAFRGYQNDGLSALTDQSYYVLAELPLSLSVLPLSLPQLLDTCVLTQLASKLNTTVLALKSGIQMSVQPANLSSAQRLEVERLMRPLIYTHITVDVSPIRTAPIQPFEHTRESLLWFLRFYGWL